MNHQLNPPVPLKRLFQSLVVLTLILVLWASLSYILQQTMNEQYLQSWLAEALNGEVQIGQLSKRGREWQIDSVQVKLPSFGELRAKKLNLTWPIFWGWGGCMGGVNLLEFTDVELDFLQKPNDIPVKKPSGSRQTLSKRLISFIHQILFGLTPSFNMHQVLVHYQNLKLSLTEAVWQGYCSQKNWVWRGQQTGHFMGLPFDGKFVITAPYHSAVHLDAELNWHKTELIAFHTAMQAQQDSPLKVWISDAIQSGYLEQGHLHLKGPLENLCLDSQSNCKGHFAFKDVELAYAKGWPAAMNVSGEVLWQDDELVIRSHSGTIQGAAIEEVLATVKPLRDKTALSLTLDGKARGKIVDGLSFLKNSPLKPSWVQFINSLGPQGLFELDLNLKLPLQSKENKLLKGKVRLKNNTLNIGNEQPIIESLEGDIYFDANTVEAPLIQFQVNGEPLQFSLKSQPISAGGSQLLAHGDVNAAFLEKQFLGAYQHVLQGKTHYSIQMDWHEASTPSLTGHLASELVGLEFKLPEPFNKAAAAPLAFRMQWQKNATNTYQYSANLPNLVDAKWLSLAQDKNAISALHVVLGEKARAELPKDNLMLIQGHLASLNEEDWRFLWASKKPRAYSKPLNVQLMLDNFIILDKIFPNTKLVLESTEKNATVNIESAAIRGNLIKEADRLAPLKINLEYLNLNTSAPSGLKNQKTPDKAQAVSFHCDSFNWNGKNMGEVGFDLFPKDYGYEISALKIKHSLWELIGAGQWQVLAGGNKTFLFGDLSTHNLGDFLRQWGYASSIEEGHGSAHFKASWLDVPTQLDHQSLAGQMQLNFYKGRVVGVNLGLGRILGLLNMESLHRRLRLDFSDLYKKGFIFDELRGSLEFAKGEVHTDALSIQGPSAQLLLAGVSRFKDNSIDLKVSVKPKVGGGLSLAAALALGHPAVGAGVWLLDKFSGSPIADFTQANYHIGGSWEKPEIKDLGQSNKLNSTDKTPIINKNTPPV